MAARFTWSRYQSTSPAVAEWRRPMWPVTAGSDPSATAARTAPRSASDTGVRRLARFGSSLGSCSRVRGGVPIPKYAQAPPRAPARRMRGTTAWSIRRTTSRRVKRSKSARTSISCSPAGDRGTVAGAPVAGRASPRRASRAARMASALAKRSAGSLARARATMASMAPLTPASGASS